MIYLVVVVESESRKSPMLEGADYSVTPYSIEHRPAVLKLHRQVLSRALGRRASYIAWKYEENPYLSGPLMALVFYESQLVAMRGLYGSRWNIPSSGRVTIPAADDLVVDKEHRNRGLFLLLDRELASMANESGFSSILSLSAGVTTQRLQSITGWKRLHRLDLARRESTAPLSRRSSTTLGKAQEAVYRTGMAVAPLWLWETEMDRVLEGITSASEHVRIDREPNVSAMVALSGQSANTCRSERGELFHAWRWRDPIRRYRFVYWEDPEIRGFLVLGHLPGTRDIKIVDSGAETPEILLSLLLAAVSAPRPSYEMNSTALPSVVREKLPYLGFHVESKDGPGQPAVFERATSDEMPTISAAGCTLEVDLVDIAV